MDLKLFVDTMVFLHFRPFDELDLQNITNASSITIVIPKVTLRELDEHKNTHRLKRIRERAGRVLVEIRDALKAGKSYNGFEIELWGKHPKDELERLGLNPNWADDLLIASISAYGDETGSAVALLTQDVPLQIVCDAHGITKYELPSDSSLPVELDETEIENQELRKEVEKFRNLQPRLDIIFDHNETQDQRIKFQIPIAEPLNEAAIRQQLEEVKSKHPKVSFNDNDIRVTVAGLAALSGISPQDWGKYNKALDEFYEQMEGHLRELHDFNIKKELIFPLRLLIRNIGTVPAEDVDVFLHFPDGFDLLSEENLPRSIKEPSPPSKPLTQLERLQMNFSLSDYVHRLGHVPQPVYRPVPSFKIRKTNSYDVLDHFGRIKHGGKGVQLPSMYVRFDTHENVRSFHSEYEIRPANTAAAFSGKLHVIFEKA